MRFHTLCALYVIMVLGGCSQSLSQISNEHGFQRFQGPSKFLQPGTLIVLEESGEGLTALSPVCWQDQAFPTLRPARAVPGAESDLKGHLGGDWHDIEPAYLTALQGKFPEVDGIQLRFRSASVVQYSDTELYKGISTRVQSCQDAIAAREANGETVYTVLKVLKADVTYNVIGVDRSRMLGKLPQKTLERLKTELGGTSVSTFDQTIKGATLQVAFQADTIGIENFSEPLAKAESDPVSGEEANVVSSDAGVISDTEAGESPQVSRLTKAQRQSIINKIAILSSKTSDADRLQE